MIFNQFISRALLFFLSVCTLQLPVFAEVSRFREGSQQCFGRWVYHQYKECRHENHGVEHYNVGAHKDCGVLQYKEGTGEVCGVDLYKEGRGPVCGVEEYNTGIILGAPQYGNREIYEKKYFKNITFIGLGPRINPWRTSLDVRYGNFQFEPADGSPPIRFGTPVQSWRPVECVESRLQVRRIADPHFGIKSYKSCRDESFGVESYKTCRDKSFGEEYKSCRHASNGVESYNLKRTKVCGLEEKVGAMEVKDFKLPFPFPASDPDDKPTDFAICSTGDDLHEYTVKNIQKKFKFLKNRWESRNEEEFSFDKDANLLKGPMTDREKNHILHQLIHMALVHATRLDFDDFLWAGRLVSDYPEIESYAVATLSASKKIHMVSEGNSFALKSPYQQYLSVNPNSGAVSTSTTRDGELSSLKLEVIYQNVDNDPNKMVSYIKTSTGKYLGVDHAGNLYTIANKDWWERFTFEKIPNTEDIFNIRTVHDQYLSFSRDGKIFAYSNPQHLILKNGKNDTFLDLYPRRDIYINLGSELVTLKDGHGQYLLVKQGTDDVISGRASDGASSYTMEVKETQVDGDPSKQIVCFKSSNGKYLGAAPSGRLYVIGHNDRWERFILEKQPGTENLFHIKTVHGSYISFVGKSQAFAVDFEDDVPLSHITWTQD